MWAAETAGVYLITAMLGDAAVAGCPVACTGVSFTLDSHMSSCHQSPTCTKIIGSQTKLKQVLRVFKGEEGPFLVLSCRNKGSSLPACNLCQGINR